MSRYMTWGVAVLCTATVSACAADTSTSEVSEVTGECVAAFGSQVCTWARMDASTVVEVGATVPLTSIENAPPEVPMSWPPAVVAAPAMPPSSGLSHLTMYWEPTGHPPTTFMTPHFDFHFYLAPRAEQLAIDCSDLTKPAALPAGYVLPDEVLPPDVAQMIGVDTLVGVCVPEMGMHSLVEVELASDAPFRGTMVLGYYRGEPIFIEPMLSRAMLLERQPFSLEIPRLPGFTGQQPTAFRAEYDVALDAYRFIFSGFSPAS